MANFLLRLVTLCQAADSTVRRRRRARNSKAVARSRFLRFEDMEDRSLLSATVLLQEQDRVPLGPALLASPKAPSVISTNLRTKQAAILQEADAGSPNGLSGLSDRAVRVDSGGRMQVYVYVDSITVEQVRLLRLAGLQFEVSNSAMSVVQGWIPAEMLNTLATVSGVKRITAPDYAQAQTGSVNTAGDAILNADDVRALGIDGRSKSVV